MLMGGVGARLMRTQVVGARRYNTLRDENAFNRLFRRLLVMKRRYLARQIGILT